MRLNAAISTCEVALGDALPCEVALREHVFSSNVDVPGHASPALFDAIPPGQEKALNSGATLPGPEEYKQPSQDQLQCGHLDEMSSTAGHASPVQSDAYRPAGQPAAPLTDSLSAASHADLALRAACRVDDVISFNAAISACEKGLECRAVDKADNHDARGIASRGDLTYMAAPQ
eukprot:6271090-Karenia_brevis.AAC.1